MNKQSQIQFIIKELVENGYIDNIYCINSKILRLASRINDIRDILQSMSKRSRDYIKNNILWTDERRDSDSNTHYYASKRGIEYLKKLMK